MRDYALTLVQIIACVYDLCQTNAFYKQK